MERKNILGILALVLGFLLILFPILGAFSLSVVAGISLIFLGVYSLVTSIQAWRYSKLSTVLMFIVGILALVVGFIITGNIIAFSVFMVWYFWIAGFLLILSGLSGLITRNLIGRTSSVVWIISGIISFIWGLLVFKNPLLVGVLIGIALIMDGVYFLLTKEPVENILE